MSLGVVELLEKILFNACQLTMEPSEQVTYHVKVALSNDCIKNSNNSAPLTAGGSFITGPHLDI